MSIIAHEVAHGWTALQLGDPTAKMMGRLTFNPLKHIDPVMSIIVPVMFYLSMGFIFGGAKPVPINPFHFKKPDRDMMISSIAGPLANILIGIFFSILLVITVQLRGRENPAFNIFLMSAYINFFLAMFNLIPIPPLDGSRVMRYFMPEDIKKGMDKMERFGFIILVVIIMSPLGDPIFRSFYYIMDLYFRTILPS